MSYDPDPSHYVNSSFIIWHLVDVVAKGGLMQIGYGPDRDGEFHPLAIKALHETGDWLAENGEAIYATRSMPVHWNDTASDFVRYTRSKDNSTIYAIALTSLGDAKPLPASLELACVVPKPGSDIYMYGHNSSALKWTMNAGILHINIGALPTKLTGKPGYAFKIVGQPAKKC